MQPTKRQLLKFIRLRIERVQESHYSCFGQDHAKRIRFGNSGKLGGYFGQRKPTGFNDLSWSKNLAPNVIAEDGSVAIRIVQDAFCQEMIKSFGKPIVSTSANISGEPTPKSYKEISSRVLDKVNYVINLRTEEINSKSSKIIRLLSDNTVEVIRE